jgi:hypothetical protein
MPEVQAAQQKWRLWDWSWYAGVCVEQVVITCIYNVNVIYYSSRPVRPDQEWQRIPKQPYSAFSLLLISNSQWMSLVFFLR